MISIRPAAGPAMLLIGLLLAASMLACGGLSTLQPAPELIDAPPATSTPRPPPTPAPTNTPVSTNTPRPTDTPVPTNTPRPTNMPVFIATIAPTDTPTMPEQIATILPETPTVAAPAVDYVATTAAQCICDRDAYNCGDSAARICFAECNRRGAGDIHRLDRDNDGNACD